MDKKQLIRWIMDALVVVAIAFGSWSMGKINTMEDNQIRQEIDIRSNRDALNVLGAKLDRLSEAVEAWAFEQEVQNRLAQYQMRDRWTAAMQEDLQNSWFNMLSELHPEIKHNDLPSIREIQRRYPEGALSASVEP